MEKTILQLLKAAGVPSVGARIILLAGDASTRRYFRVVVDQHKTSYIVMVLGEKGGAEEAGSPTGDGELAFVSVQRFLKANAVDVPDILHFDEAAGLMLLEDLGDETLLLWTKSKNPEQVEGMYKRALAMLVQIQQSTGKLAAHLGVAEGQFDEALLFWEFEHFVEYGLERRYRPLSAEDRQAVNEILKSLSKEMAEWPQVLVHRDYHSRNLMVLGERIATIDFQDALMGPVAYDVVSLLRDAYIELPQKMVTALNAYFLAQLHREVGIQINSEAFERQFDLCTVHRCLKAAGRFEYFYFNNNNDAYLPDVPRAKAYARAAMMRHGDLRRLLAIYGRYCPEFAVT